VHWYSCQFGSAHAARGSNLLQRDLSQGNDGHTNCDEDGYGFWVSVRDENVLGNLVTDAFAKHEKTNNSHEEIESGSEGVSDVDTTTVLVRVAHIAVNVGKDAVAAPWRHEQTKRKRNGNPVLGEEKRLGRRAKGSRRIRFDETVNYDCRNDWNMSA